MTRKQFKGVLGEKLKKIKQIHKFDYRTMASKLNIDKSTYNRNEKAISLPEALSLYYMGENLNISMDWFIRGKGPMYFTEKKPVESVEKEIEKIEPTKPYTLPPVLQKLEDDLKELFESMQQSSKLRYEILAHYHKFKDEQGKD